MYLAKAKKNIFQRVLSRGADSCYFFTSMNATNLGLGHFIVPILSRLSRVISGQQVEKKRPSVEPVNVSEIYWDTALLVLVLYDFEKTVFCRQVPNCKITAKHTQIKFKFENLKKLLFWLPILVNFGNLIEEGKFIKLLTQDQSNKPPHELTTIEAKRFSSKGSDELSGSCGSICPYPGTDLRRVQRC